MTNEAQLFKRIQQYVQHPTWMADIKEDLRRIMMTSTLVAEMVRGNRRAHERYWIAIAPFSEVFPKTVKATIGRLLAQPMMDRLGLKAHALYDQGIAALYGMHDEEQIHWDLWLDAGERMGVSRKAMYAPAIPEVDYLNHWISGVDATLVQTFLRFGAAEIVAEEVGRYFDCSDLFNRLYGMKHVPWVIAHINHAGGVDHEQLAYQFAKLCAQCQLGPEPDEALCRQEILETARVFHAAGEAAWAMA